MLGAQAVFATISETRPTQMGSNQVVPYPDYCSLVITIHSNYYEIQFFLVLKLQYPVMRFDTSELS